MKALATSLFICFVPFLSSFAQDAVPKYYEATRIDQPPVINGDLGDEAWNYGNWQSDLVQHEPYENRPPSQPTEFKICYDKEHLYVAIKALDESPDSITRRMERRDKADGDMVFILFDSYHDLRTGFIFGLSPVSVRFDQIMSEDGASEDLSWDPIWQARAKIHNWGWAAEMKIPFTQLRFQKNSGDVWGLIVGRQIFRHNEMSFWPAIPRDASGIVHMAAELGGLSDVEPRKQFDITPYTVASFNSYEPGEGNPFLPGYDWKIKGGLDAKIGVSNNLTLDLTVLPDFGQIEADPSQVNLTAFESYFQEKRPFFVEGNNITSFDVGSGGNNENIFYSRRIGRSPQMEVELDDDEYANTPAFTNILGAAKLTGKTRDGFSVGFIESVTGEMAADIDSADRRSSMIVEPLTNYALARVQKDFNKGNSILGGIVTSTIRKSGGILTDELHQDATTAGIDFAKYFKDKEYRIKSSLFMSHVTGSEKAILNTQESSARYYQRPDAEYIHIDSTRRSLTGAGIDLEAGKIGGKWNYLLISNWKSPGLELNDMGFQREADKILNVLWTGYNFTEPFSIFRSLNLSNNIYMVNDFGGNIRGIGYEWNINASLKNFWYAGTGGGYSFHRRSKALLRGGPSMKMPDSFRSWFHVSSDQHKKFAMNLFGDLHLEHFQSTEEFSLGCSFILRPMNNLKISLSPDYSIRNDVLQYIDTYSFKNNQRYLFGTIEQKVLSSSIRINYTILPGLTIQYWGQPFIAVGNYDHFKRITDPNANRWTDRFAAINATQISLLDGEYIIDEDLNGNRDYSFENPDFQVDEWLSNLVIRWEYHPGSTFYFVWSQSRNYDETGNSFDLINNMQKLFSEEKANNIFLIKVSFRLGLR